MASMPRPVSATERQTLEAANRQWPGRVVPFDSKLWADIDEADVDSIPQLLALGQADAAKVDWKKTLQLP
jgi:hypothetical protein